MRSGVSKPNRPSPVSSAPASRGESWRLAGAITTPMGMPWPSTASERLVPCFPLSTGDRPATCPAQGALTMQPSTHMRVRPGAHHLVVCGQCSVLQGAEDACGDPLVPAPPDGGGRAGVVCDPVVRGAQD